MHRLLEALIHWWGSSSFAVVLLFTSNAMSSTHPLALSPLPTSSCFPKTDITLTHPGSRKDPYVPKLFTQNYLPAFSVWPAFTATSAKLTLLLWALTAPTEGSFGICIQGRPPLDRKKQEHLRSLTINWKTTPVFYTYKYSLIQPVFHYLPSQVCMMCGILSSTIC